MPKLVRALSLLVCASTPAFSQAQHVAASEPTTLRVLRFLDNAKVEFGASSASSTIKIGERFGSWTLMEISRPTKGSLKRYIVLENFESQTGHILFVDSGGVQLALPKSLEPTFENPDRLYLGHSLKEVLDSPKDLLANELLSKPGDPVYDEVAAIFPPIRNFKTYTFVGTPDIIDKVGFQYGGRTPDFDPAPYVPAINQIRDSGKVWDGLVGGYLPVLRFVYPESDSAWTEMLAFAPLRIANGNNRIQPVWYRVCRIENGELKWAKYIDSYHPYPPHTGYDSKEFFSDLGQLKSGWDSILSQSMQIQLPDERLANMARHSLIRSIMTRVGDYPKYGVYDTNYAGSEHDGFPDTFTVETAAMLDWGLLARAGRYIDNYFGQFVRDDGSLLYRGPETGQYGRMLTVVAQFAALGGDPQILLKRRSRIDGVTKLLLGLRANALSLPKDDPAYGMIAGWSEADACLDPEPNRYIQPYFSNSTEAARGFRDLGRAWQSIGRKTSNTQLIAWGRKLEREGNALAQDLETAIARSILNVDGEKILPSIAGVHEPFHLAVANDSADPQFRSYRAYMEMMYSGILSDEQLKLITAYRASHYDSILGLPTAYGLKSSELAGFLTYGIGYGLIQSDQIRETLLLLYSDVAHQYTRGTWTAPETRSILPDRAAAPYCTPAELVVALLTRWLLVFEDPQSDTLWLGKGIPRTWLEDGKTTSVTSAKTRWGRVSFSLASHLATNSSPPQSTSQRPLLPHKQNSASALPVAGNLPPSPSTASPGPNSTQTKKPSPYPPAPLAAQESSQPTEVALARYPKLCLFAQVRFGHLPPTFLRVLALTLLTIKGRYGGRDRQIALPSLFYA